MTHLMFPEIFIAIVYFVALGNFVMNNDLHFNLLDSKERFSLSSSIIPLIRPSLLISRFFPPLIGD